MKSYKLVVFIFVVSLAFCFNVNAQDDCCDDDFVGMDEAEWERQMADCDAARRDLLAQLESLNSEIDQLRRTLADRDTELQRAEDDLYAAVGSTRQGVADFRSKFEEAERRINNCRGPEDAADIRATLFSEIAASRIRCLPEFWDRFLAMQRKLEECEGRVVTTRCEKEYTVVRGDCLWRIAGRSDIYGNPRLWPKIWEANRDGVISAPPGVPNRITNPNLIYPGQVLCIPALTEAERQMRVRTTIERTRRARTK
jgi:nucleoid-associated protein YgaU